MTYEIRCDYKPLGQDFILHKGTRLRRVADEVGEYCYERVDDGLLCCGIPMVLLTTVEG